MLFRGRQAVFRYVYLNLKGYIKFSNIYTQLILQHKTLLNGIHTFVYSNKL